MSLNKCCSESAVKQHFVIVGGGSAAFAAALKASSLGWEVTLINSSRLPIGGTCVNVGCVPSKTLIRGAEVLHRANNQNFNGILSSAKILSFKDVIAQKRDLVASLRQAKYIDVVSDLQDFEIVEGEARVVTANTVRVGERTIKADRILLATGASPRILPIDGLQSVPYVTHEGAFELDLLPESLIVLGGRYVALECAQMFARFGSKVTILQRSSHVLPTESKDVSEEIASHLVNEGVVLHTNVKISKCLKRGGNAVVIAVVNGKPMEFTAALLLVATGHTPNNAAVDDLADINLDGGGYITVNEYLETSVPGVFAAGDVIGDPSFVYTAAYEGGLAASNACMDSTKAERNYTGLPWVVFTDPQVAGVGIDETQAKLDGIAVDVSVLPMASVPRCIAARDTRGFVKLIRHSSTKVILGARVVAAEGSELLMELSLAIKHGITSRELAASFHPYLTLSEAVKLAAIAFDTPVGKLSCCAN